MHSTIPALEWNETDPASRDRWLQTDALADDAGSPAGLRFESNSTARHKRPGQGPARERSGVSRPYEVGECSRGASEVCGPPPWRLQTRRDQHLLKLAHQSQTLMLVEGEIQSSRQIGHGSTR